MNHCVLTVPLTHVCHFKFKGILGNSMGRSHEACLDHKAPELIETVKVTTSRSVELRSRGSSGAGGREIRSKYSVQAGRRESLHQPRTVANGNSKR